MKRYNILGLAVVVLAACAPSAPAPTTPAPVPAPTVTPGPAAPNTSAPAVREAPPDWQRLDWQTDSVIGMGSERAVRELLAGQQPRRTVVVAVIDGGIDTAHVSLRANLWSNSKEIPGNSKDDDGNGYVDDFHGWNFIGGADGRDVEYDTHEVTRLYSTCRMANTDSVPPDLRARCPAIGADYDRRRGEAEQTLLNVKGADAALTGAVKELKKALNADTVTVAAVRALMPSSGKARQARSLFLELDSAGINEQVIAEALKAYESQIRYGFNTDYNSRGIVGDNYADVNQRIYGNSDVMGPDAEHGTHVAGIIGAVPNDSMAGIASAVKLMMVRTVPDGDERDKDVANAIRYAVDNGAHIINMSFGKAYSPRKDAVDAAVRYAQEKGVLLVHAAGNDAEDISKNNNFPTPLYSGGGRAPNWIEVGASSWKGLDSLVAPFSNYGRNEVDVFAPGVDILSTVPGGGYERNSGTSMAAPVVSGLAALLMSYYPTLTAADVKKIIVSSATSYASQMVVAPESGARRGPAEPVRFGDLSSSGGVVNAMAAIRMAQQMETTTP